MVNLNVSERDLEQRKLERNAITQFLRTVKSLPVEWGDILNWTSFTDTATHKRKYKVGFHLRQRNANGQDFITNKQIVFPDTELMKFINSDAFDPDYTKTSKTALAEGFSGSTDTATSTFPVTDKRATAPKLTWMDEVITTDRTWETIRERAILAASPKDSSKTGKDPRIDLAEDGKLRCNCLATSTTTLCAHVAALFLTGRDRHKILNSLTVKSAAKDLREIKIKLPLGLGAFFITVGLRPVYDDSGKMTGDFVAKSMISKSEEILVPKDEGLLPVIKYLEDILRSHTLYGLLMEATDAEAVALADGSCSRSSRHVRDTRVRLTAAFRSHPNKGNMVLANVATLSLYDRCNPCYEVTLGADDVPDV